MFSARSSYKAPTDDNILVLSLALSRVKLSIVVNTNEKSE